MKKQASLEPDTESPEAISTDDTLVDSILSSVSPNMPTIDGVVVACFVGFDASGDPLIDFPGNPAGTPLSARATIELNETQLGCEVAVMFQSGDVRRPIVMGRMATGKRAPAEGAPEDSSPEAVADGERLVFEAEKEIVLKCGKASITLTRAGKIIIRGEYVLTRSTGVNRIQGGSVQIN